MAALIRMLIRPVPSPSASGFFSPAMARIDLSSASGGRGPMIGYPGSLLNWLLGLVAVAMIVWLLVWQRHRPTDSARLASRHRGGMCGVVSLIMPPALGIFEWTAHFQTTVLASLQTKEAFWQMVQGSGLGGQS